MKRLLKWALRVLSLALILAAAAALFPYVRGWLGGLLPQAKYERTAALLSHEMEKAGELTAVRHTDTGVMTARTNALLIGTVQQVSVSYAYEIGLGFSLADVRLRAEEGSLIAALPEIRMLYDRFEVTDAPQVQDFWYRLTEARYQQMINDQAAACRAEYLENPAFREEAWSAACEALEKLFSQWAGESLSVRFVRAAGE